MAKINGKLKLATLIITLVLIFAGIITNYVRGQESLKTLKEDGCKKAQQAQTDVLLLKKDVEYIREGIDEIKKKL
jgi:peptidoglycan hydrolase CwlO-like protein